MLQTIEFKQKKQITNNRRCNMAYSEWKEKTEGFKKVDVRGVAGDFLEGIKKQAAGLPEGEGIEIVQTFEPIPPL